MGLGRWEERECVEVFTAWQFGLFREGMKMLRTRETRSEHQLLVLE